MIIICLFIKTFIALEVFQRSVQAVSELIDGEFGSQIAAIKHFLSTFSCSSSQHIIYWWVNINSRPSKKSKNFFPGTRYWSCRVCAFTAVRWLICHSLVWAPDKQGELLPTSPFEVLYKTTVYILAHHCQLWPLLTFLFLFSPTFTSQPVDWEETLASLKVDRTVAVPEWSTPGTKGGVAMLESFIDVRLKLFDTLRNDPNAAALSQLSPWIRFGQ